MLTTAHLCAGMCCLQELPAQHVHQLLDQMLQRDLQPLLQPQQQLGDAGQQFVMSRALMLGAELRDAATTAHKEHMLQAAVAAGQAPLGCKLCCSHLVRLACTVMVTLPIGNSQQVPFLLFG